MLNLLPTLLDPELGAVSFSVERLTYRRSGGTVTSSSLTFSAVGNIHPGTTEMIRSFLYLDGSGFPRAILRKAGIYPLPRPPQPLLLHEPEGSLWRRRADLVISLRVSDTVTHSRQRGTISSPPALILHQAH